MVQEIRMNVNDTLELDYLIEQISDNTIEVESEPESVSSSIDYAQKRYGIFDPPDAGTYRLDINGQKIKIQVINIPNSGVSHWTFDEFDTSNGKSLDIWGDNNLTLNSPGTGVSGIADYNSGEAYDFGGSDEAYYTYSESEMSQYTITFWVKFRSETKILADDDNGNTNPIDTLEAELRNKEIRIYVGEWNAFGDLEIDTAAFVGISVDNTIPETTVDIGGSRQTKSIGIDLFQHENGRLVFGRGQSGYRKSLDGILDDPRLFDKRLSATELSNLRSTGSIKE